MLFPWFSVQLVIVQRTPPRFVPYLVVNEQQGREGHNDTRQAEGEDVTDIMARHTGAGPVSRQFGLGHFGFEAGMVVFLLSVQEVKRGQPGMVALD